MFDGQNLISPMKFSGLKVWLDASTVNNPNAVNLLSENQYSVENDTYGFTEKLGATLTKTADEKYVGNYSLKVVTPNVAAWEGVYFNRIAVSPSIPYYAMVWVKGTNSSACVLAMTEYDAADAYVAASTTAFTATGSWQKVVITRTLGATAAFVRLSVETSAKASETFYLDNNWLCSTVVDSLADNDKVYAWHDSSGNGNSPTQATEARRPLYKTNICNGLPVVRFDGTDDRLEKSYAAALTQPTTIIIVAKTTVVTEERYFYDGVLATNRHALYLKNNLLNNYAGATGTYGFDTAINTTNFVIYGNVFNGADSNLWVNKSSIKISNNGTHTMDGLKLGMSCFAAYYLNGDVAEVIIYNKALSTYEYYQLYNYLAKKWGIRCYSGVVSDSFNRADSNSSMGVSESNHTWVAGSYDTTDLPTIGISSNKGYFPACTGTDSHAYVETGKANCTINVNFINDSVADTDKGIIFRRVDANNYFWAHCDSAGDTIKISRCLAGVRSDLASAAYAHGKGVTFQMRVMLSGDQITVVTTPGNVIATVTDANLQTATKHGIYNASGNQAAFDYFTVEEA